MARSKQRRGFKKFEKKLVGKTIEREINFGNAGASIAETKSLLAKAMSLRGKQTERDIKTTLSVQWSQGESGAGFPRMRSQRLRKSIGHAVINEANAVTLATGIMRQVGLKPGDLPPSVWGWQHEYGNVIKMKNPARPFFYIPLPNSPAIQSNGMIDRDWMPGKRLRERLKKIGKASGVRMYYFPYPLELSAPKRVIYIAQVKRQRSAYGKARRQIKVTPIAVGVREFKIPARPFLRPAWRRLYDPHGGGMLNEDLDSSTQELMDRIARGPQAKSLSEFAWVTYNLNLKLRLF